MPPGSPPKHLSPPPRTPGSLPRFKEVSARSKEELVAQGFTEFTIEDFHNTVGTRGPGDTGWGWGTEHRDRGGRGPCDPHV